VRETVRLHASETASVTVASIGGASGTVVAAMIL
jgi:hypothetical protein